MADDKSWRLKINWHYRINNLEIMSCDSRLGHDGMQDRAEISQWAEDNSSRWVVATFEPTSCGYDLRTIGDRPLAKTVRWKDFKKIAKLGFKLLEEQLLTSKDKVF